MNSEEASKGEGNEASCPAACMNGQPSGHAVAAQAPCCHYVGRYLASARDSHYFPNASNARPLRSPLLPALQLTVWLAVLVDVLVLLGMRVPERVMLAVWLAVELGVRVWLAVWLAVWLGV